MIKMCKQDFIIWPEFATDGAAHCKCERGHVRAKDNFVFVATEKIGHGGARSGDYLIGIAAGLIGAAGVCTIASKIVRDCINNPLRNLRSARAIEKCSRLPVYVLRERRELPARPCEIKLWRKFNRGMSHGNQI